MTNETAGDAGAAEVPASGDPVVPPPAEPYTPAHPAQWAYTESVTEAAHESLPPSAPPAPSIAVTAPPYTQPGAADASPHPPSAVPIVSGGQPAPSGSEPPARRMPKGAVLGIVGGGLALVLAVVAGAVVFGILRSPGGDASAGSATEAVQKYLSAIADGDADAALAFVAHGEDDVLLSAEMLRASNERGGIGEFTVGEESEGEHGDTVVEVTLAIDGDTRERTFSVAETGDGWSISDGLMMFSAPYSLLDLGLTINGEPSPDYGFVFPGSYEFALDSEAFEIVGDPSYRFLDDESALAFADLEPRLTDGAQQTFRDLVRASLEECLASTALVTPCGMDITKADLDGFAPVDGTVRRTLSEGAAAVLESLEATDVIGAEAGTYERIEVDSAVIGERDGERREFPRTWGGDLGVPTVDFGAEHPAVEWR